MSDSGLQRTIEALEVSFEAALHRSEEAAADDLAFSLRQDSRLPVALTRLGAYHLHLAGSAAREVAVIGADFVGGGNPLELMVPVARAVIVRTPAVDTDAAPPPRPESTRASMLEILRRWARHAARVELATQEGSFRGLLTGACPDHLSLDCGTREILVGTGAVGYVRRVLED